MNKIKLELLLTVYYREHLSDRHIL